MVGLGIGEMIGGFLISFFVQKKGMRVAVFVQMALTIVAFSILIATNEVNKF